MRSAQSKPDVQPFASAVTWEVNPDFTRGEVVIAVGSNTAENPLRVNTVLGKITASGKYVPLNPSATDGSQNAAGILYTDHVDASEADQEVVALVRGCALYCLENLILKNPLSDVQKAAAEAALRTLNIVRVKTAK